MLISKGRMIMEAYNKVGSLHNNGAILDSIKEIIEVDDRYYAHSIDWAKSPERPRFEATVRQKCQNGEQ